MILETIEQGVEYCNRFRDPLAEAEDCVLKASKHTVNADNKIRKRIELNRLKYWVAVYEVIKNQTKK